MTLLYLYGHTVWIAIAMSHDNYYARRRVIPFSVWNTVLVSFTRCGNTKIDGHARMGTILVLGVHSGDDYSVPRKLPRTLHA